MRWGIVDFDAWLSNLDPRVLDQWVAFDRVEPISDPWQHTGTIASEVHEVVRWIAMERGVQVEATSPDDYRPRRAVPRATPGGDDAYDHMAAVMHGSLR